jgi:hypothetical protein
MREAVFLVQTFNNANDASVETQWACGLQVRRERTPHRTQTFVESRRIMSDAETDDYPTHNIFRSGSSP